MDWSPIIAGGITGLLSGAISGNLVQYVLDKKRIRHKRRLEFIESWRNIINNAPTYSAIISEPSYSVLEEFISPKVVSFLRQDLAKAEDKVKLLKSEFEVYGDYACNLGLDELYERATDEEAISLPPYQNPMGELESETTAQMVSLLHQELRKLEKKWGLL